MRLPAFRPSARRPALAAGAQPSSAWLLVLVYGLLLTYASLHPFTGWRWPALEGGGAFLRLPLPPVRIQFDVWSNLLGYVPMGALVCLAALRSAWHPGWALGLAVLGPGLFSYAAEVSQHFLPGRYPSVLDWVLNTAGAALGAVVVLLTWWAAWLDGWQRLRQRWFLRHSAGAMALLAVWPLALLFPPPFPLGLGLAWARLQGVMVDGLLDVPWAQQALEWLAAWPTPERPLAPWLEALGSGLGLLAPLLLAYSVMPRGPHRRWLAGLLVLAGGLASVLSGALSFGPAHAWSGWTLWVLGGISSALCLAWILAGLPARRAGWLCALCLCGLMAVVALAPLDAYFVQSLQDWEQSRWVRFFGLAQWLGWLWPLLALAWLLMAGLRQVESSTAAA